MGTVSQQRRLNIFRHKDLPSDLKDLLWSESDCAVFSSYPLVLSVLCPRGINITNESREAEIRQIFVRSLVLFGGSSMSRLKDIGYCLREDHSCDHGFPL